MLHCLKIGCCFRLLQDDPVVFLQSGKSSFDVDVKHIESMIEARNQARADKDWQEADRIRDELLGLKIVLEDGTGVTSWKRA